MRLPEELDSPPSINILPMIDVIFAILVFFIVSSLLFDPLRRFTGKSPPSQTTEVQKTQPITVSLDEKQQLSVNSKPIQLKKFTGRTKKVNSVKISDNSNYQCRSVRSPRSSS